MKTETEIEHFRDRIADLITSDRVLTGGDFWQKLEAAEVALDWALEDSDGDGDSDHVHVLERFVETLDEGEGRR